MVLNTFGYYYILKSEILNQLMTIKIYFLNTSDNKKL